MDVGCNVLEVGIMVGALKSLVRVLIGELHAALPHVSVADLVDYFGFVNIRELH